MWFRQVFDPHLAQYAYMVGCQRTKEAIVFDPERDVDRYVDLAAAEGLRITAVTETHIHADFLSGCREFAERFGVRVYLSDEGGDAWKYGWTGAGDYDVQLLKDGDRFTVGHVEFTAVHSPGHTPEHLSFMVNERGDGAPQPLGVISGDFVFVGDIGRPDLLESAAGHVGAKDPAARTLYRSVQNFLELPDYLQVWPGHGAGSACGKALGAVPTSTVGYERRHNSALDAAHRGEEAFVGAILTGQPEPPFYFARMKRWNREGPPLLGDLPTPARLTPSDLLGLAGRPDVAVLDTRADARLFMGGHFPGSLYAPLDKSFPTVVGSTVEEGIPIYLIADENRVEDAVRDLIRIGFDTVVGFASPSTLEAYRREGGELRTTAVIDFERVKTLHERAEVHVLDVRRRAEYEAGHVPDAQNIAHTRLLARRDEIPRDRPIAVHCQSGIRAAVASAFLERHGYNVLYVRDNFKNWR